MKGPENLNRRIAWADTARALAMVWIVGFWHAMGGYCPRFWETLETQSSFRFLSGVTTGVLGAFMFLSSRLICSRHSFANQHDVLAFYRSRFVRIFPLYLLALVSFPNVGFDNHGVAVRIFALFGLSQYIPGFGIMTLWFISALVSFYALLPLLAADWMSTGRRIALGLSLAALFFVLPEWIGSDRRIPICFAPFLLGIWTSRRTPRHPLLETATLSAIWSFLLWLPQETPLRDLLLSALGWAPLQLVSTPLSKLPGSGRCWRFLAYVSFAAYLFHRQVYKVFVHFLPPEGPLRPIIVAAVGFPLVLAFSFVMQRLGDRTATVARWPRSRTRRPPDPIVSRQTTP